MDNEAAPGFDGNKTTRKRYLVDFYDDWEMAWDNSDAMTFDSLEAAVQACNLKQAEVPEEDKEMGDHYGVIDLQTGLEVYCTRKPKRHERGLA